MRITSLAAFLMLSTATITATAEGLGIGDPAPALGVGKWVKGERFDKLEPGQTYVVEFWATWCPPCRDSIPHLTELQKKYKDKGVKFIGVSVWERDPKLVEPFVKEMGEKMGYSVAADSIPDGEDGNSGKMAKTWMTAADLDGIPAAFVVKDKKVIWIGHPMQIDAPLGQIVDGKYDVDAAASKYREGKALDRKMAAIVPKITPLLQQKKFKDAVAIIDDAIANEPKLETRLFQPKFNFLSQAGDEAAANAYASQYVDKATEDDAQTLNDIAWKIVDPDAPKKDEKPDLTLALKAASKANSLLKGEDGAVLDTLAAVYFAKGDLQNAIDSQDKAVNLMAAGTTIDNEVKLRLDKYRKALKDKK